MTGPRHGHVSHLDHHARECLGEEKVGDRKDGADGDRDEKRYQTTGREQARVAGPSTAAVLDLDDGKVREHDKGSELDQEEDQGP